MKVLFCHRGVLCTLTFSFEVEGALRGTCSQKPRCCPFPLGSSLPEKGEGKQVSYRVCFSTALFLVDAVNEMYLWHGWWPNDEDSESRASTTGSAETRWSNDRRLAMETIKSYAQGTVLFSPTTIIPLPPPRPLPNPCKVLFPLPQTGLEI